MGVLDVPFVRRIRRNHAIEHATIHMLGRRYPNVHLAGRSDSSGFYIYGDVKAEDVWEAAEEAIERLKDQPELAVHPMCGTNMVVGGLVAGVLSLAAVASLTDDRKPVKLLDALPRFVLAGTVAMVASQPLGPAVQRRITTLPEPEGLKVRDVQRHGTDRHVVHRVSLAEVAA
jgi:hypothetical protein